MLKEHNFCPENIYGFDKSGFPLGGSKKTHVISARFGSGTTQHDNNKENVTIMACICADGSNVPPIVVFLKASISWRSGFKRIQLMQHKC